MLSETPNTVPSRSDLRFNSHVVSNLGGSLDLDSNNDIEVAEGSDGVLEQIDSDMDALESS